MRLFGAVAAALAVVAALPVARSQPIVPLNWGSTSASFTSPTADGVPVGCTCIDTSQNPCQKFDCSCTCDLTALVCDPNCCCDADCSSAATDRFRAAGTCLPEGPVESAVVQCLDAESAAQLAEVNPRYRMTVSRRTASGQEVLCVAVDNSPIVGTFYEDPGTLPTAVFARDDIAELPTYCDAGCPPSASDAPTYYAPGRPLLAATVEGSSRFAQGGGLFRLPGPVVAPTGAFGDADRAAELAADAKTRPFSASDGAALGQGATLGPGGRGEQCGLTTVVGFGEQLGLRGPTRFLGEADGGAITSRRGPTCRDRGAMTSALCASRSVARFSSRLALGTSPAAALTDDADWVPVELGRVRQLSVAADGTVSATTLSATAAAALAAETPGAGYTAGNCSCANVVTAAQFRVETSSSDTVSRALVDLDVLDVVSGCSDVALPLSGAVAFSPVNATVRSERQAASAADGRTSQRPRAGNPGYLAGEPINAGTATTTTTGGGDTLSGIAAAVDGLQLRAAGAGGLCPGWTTVEADTAAAVAQPWTPVGMAEDAVFSCAVPVSVDATAFESHCNAQSGVVPDFLATNWTHVGKYGNADPLDPDQWIAVSSSVSASTTYASSTRSCDGLVLEAHLQILGARTGEVGNPQRRIAAARLDYATGAVSLPADADLRAGNFSYELRFVVSYAELGAGDLTPFIPPPPSVVRLPFDLWYPFQLDERDAATSAAIVDASLVNTDAVVQAASTTAIGITAAIAVAVVAWGFAGARRL